MGKLSLKFQEKRFRNFEDYLNFLETFFLNLPWNFETFSSEFGVALEIRRGAFCFSRADVTSKLSF